jgi:hypothetical protein
MMDDNKKKLSTEETENNIDKANLDALMFDSDDEISNKTPEDSVNFEAFMAEYRNLMGKNMEQATEKMTKSTEENEEDFLISLPKKKQEKKNKKKQDDKNKALSNNPDWSEEITLAPGEYEDLDDGKEMLDEIPAEPTPDFNLGEVIQESDNKFQLSINFENEQKPIMEDVVEKEAKYNPDKPRTIDWIFDITEMFVFVLAVVLILTSFLFKHSVV